jgi:hypothetical protein
MMEKGMEKNLSEWNKVTQWKKNWAKTVLMQLKCVCSACLIHLPLTLGEPGSHSISVFNSGHSYLNLTY